MEYPVWMIAWLQTKEGDILVKEEIVKNEREDENFSKRYSGKIIKTRELTNDERINHGFAPLLEKIPISHNVVTTPKKNDANATWYKSPLFKYFIWPLLVLLIGTYIAHLFGWV
jgi:hypothetical protein